MSTIRTNTLSNVAGTQSTAIENAINGSAKAWVNFNGQGTVAIRAAHNVSSITDQGAGDYTVNFTTALADANYCVAGIGHSKTGEYTRNIQVKDTPTSSNVRVATDVAIGLYDTTYAFVTIFR